jgi:hypothetical protein
MNGDWNGLERLDWVYIGVLREHCSIALEGARDAHMGLWVLKADLV